MHDIIFYADRQGREPVVEYMKELADTGGKDARIKLNKIRDYIRALSSTGTQLPETYVKHLSGAIWELRPIRDRILFAAWVDGSFVLLHVFIKKTQKTPRAEIERAKRELDDFKARWNDSGDQEGL